MTTQKMIFILVLLIFLVWLEYIYLRDYNLHKIMNPEHYIQVFSKSRHVENMNHLKDKKIVFCGLARNVEQNIKKNIENCVLLGSFFQDYKIILFENDSHDDTRDIIKNMTNPNIVLIECDGNPDCHFGTRELYEYGLMNPNRIDKMALYRNLYLHVVYSKYAHYDYMCVLDFDVEGVISIHGLQHAIKCPFDWSCICANGRSGIPGTFGLLDTMYDGMAFAMDKNDLQQSKQGNRSLLHLIYKYLKLLKLSHLNNSNDINSFLPILSAFNGFAIYKIKDILEIYYHYGYSCEHISFHEQLLSRNKYIYIDLLLTLYVGHQGPKQLTHFFIS